MSLSKIVAAEAAAAVRAVWTRAGDRVVFTNGVFDILHRGHIELLSAARARGDHLVVGVNDDASVRRIKGPERPLVPLEDRMAILAALAAVDLVVPFSEDTPENLIRLLRPDVLIKGADYSQHEIVGAADVLSYGGTVETVPLTAGRSTSALVDAICERRGAARADRAS